MITKTLASYRPVEYLPDLIKRGAGICGQQLAGRIRTVIPNTNLMRASGFRFGLRAIGKGNPDKAKEYYLGRFAFGDTVVETRGRLIFDHHIPDPVFNARLHSFTWLGDLAANNRELSRVQARAYVTDWIERSQRHSVIAHSARVTARRLLSWLQYRDFLFQGAAKRFEQQILSSMNRQIRRLHRHGCHHSDTEDRLSSALALWACSICLQGLEAMRETTAKRLFDELDAQILADGGHISRNPAKVLDILADLLPLRAVLEEAKLEIPSQLTAVIERMFPMLRFWMHGDDGLCLFNGVNDTSAGRLRDLIKADTSLGHPLMHAPHSGYARLRQKSLRAIMDCGQPAAPGHNTHGHCAPLAFEFSDAGNRIVVNCGSSPGTDEIWQRSCQLTAAHSTVSLADSNAGMIIDNRFSQMVFRTPVILGPKTVVADAYGTDQGGIIEAAHDGYLKDFGILHERRLFMGKMGNDLRGEDRFRIDLQQLEKIDAVPFAIRFHLHPSSKATLSQDKRSVVLVMQDRSGWRFTMRGGILSLDDSIYLPNSKTPRKSKQIVVTGIVGQPDVVNWAFRRIEKPVSRRKNNVSTAELPL